MTPTTPPRAGCRRTGGGRSRRRPGRHQSRRTSCVNYYNRTVVRSETTPESENLPRTVFLAPQSEWTEMGWEVHPDGLYQTLCRVHFDYGPPKLYVTENGASWSDGPGPDGRVADQRRLGFLRDHFRAARRAIAAGVPLEGFVWSLLDNFEWDRGYPSASDRGSTTAFSGASPRAPTGTAGSSRPTPSRPRLFLRLFAGFRAAGCAGPARRRRRRGAQHEVGVERGPVKRRPRSSSSRAGAAATPSPPRAGGRWSAAATCTPRSAGRRSR
jgi:hypothetical protein